MIFFIRQWLPLIAYCGLIFFQSHHPAPEGLPSIPGFDKALHLVGYGLLGALFYRAYRAQWPQSSVRMLFWASAFSAALYGISDEFHQSFVAFRTADPMDCAADAIGGLIGALAYLKSLAIAACRSARRAPNPD
jgi:VanZ family protein